jgi:hypothetical protein
MTLLVTSATGANGAGYGKILAFADDGKPIGVFGDDPYITDPRGLGIDRVDKLRFVNSGSNRILALDCNGVVVRSTRTVDSLNPGGGNFGPDGRYYVGLRGERTIMAFARELNSAGEFVLPPHVVPFPRGFAFGSDGTLFLASGVGPHGEGDNTILAFGPDRLILTIMEGKRSRSQSARPCDRAERQCRREQRASVRCCKCGNDGPRI